MAKKKYEPGVRFCLVKKRRDEPTRADLESLGAFFDTLEEVSAAAAHLPPGKYVAYSIDESGEPTGEKHPFAVVENPADAARPDLSTYDYFIVAFSGGKDSLACVLHLLDEGVPRHKIELWHHDVDGGGENFIDWPVTEDYCRKVAAALGVKFYLSYREGGFYREMMKDNARSAQAVFETPDGVQTAGGGGGVNTRLMFPMTANDLRTRWCSSFLKIEVGEFALRKQARFVGARTLMITGERAQESANRATYCSLEPDGGHSETIPRHVYRWRPVLHWDEQRVWEIIRRHRINPHPAYRLGWGRVSCAACIFGNADQFASLRAVNRKQFDRLVEVEQRIGKTMKAGKSLLQLVESGNKGGQPGEPYSIIGTPEGRRLARLATSREYTDPVIVKGAWSLPAGAFGDSTGPT